MRPVGSEFTVQAPAVLLANISITITVGSEGSRLAATAAAASSISGFINSLPIGAMLPLTKIAQLAYAADTSIINVSQIEINAVAADMTPSSSGVIKAGSIAVN